MINFCTLYSSSGGNCVFLSDGDTNILVDAGVSAAKITASLNNINLSPEEIDAVLITHEHSDHVSGVRVLANKYNIPVYANEKTMSCMLSQTGKLNTGLVRVKDSGATFEIRSAVVHSFRTPHDSAESVGYTVDFSGVKLGVATDTGCITKTMLTSLARCDAVLIESNHDVDMLKNGKYPYNIKQRILSDNGHLCNEDCAWLATQLALWGTKHIALGHLSDNNNIASYAYNASEALLEKNGINVGKDVSLGVAKKDEIYHIYR